MRLFGQECLESWISKTYLDIRLEQSAELLNKLLDHPVYKDHSLTKKLITVIHQQKEFYLSFQISSR